MGMMDNKDLLFNQFIEKEIYKLDVQELDMKKIYNLILEIKFYKVLNFNEEDVKKVINYLLDNSDKLTCEVKNSLEILIEQLELLSHKQIEGIQSSDEVKKLIYENVTEGITYSPDQMNLKKHVKKFLSTSEYKELIISAPTSFGKTKIILSEVQKYIDKKKILILVPTKALINEYKMSLNKYNVSTYHFDYNKNNADIFIGTPERFLLLEEKYFDIVIIDEAYSVSKLNLEDRDLLYVIAYKNILSDKKIIIVPSIDLSTLENAYKNVDIHFKKPEYVEYSNKQSLVTYNDYFLVLKQNGKSTITYREESNSYEVIDHEISKEKEDKTKKKLENFAFYLNKLHEKYSLLNNTIIYYNSTNITSLIYKLDYNDETAATNVYVQGLIEYIKDQIHPNYELVHALKKGFAIHNSKLDDLCKKVIEFLYRKKIIKLLITTSTISQGVNLPCRNIIFTTSALNINTIDGKNTIARAGRFKEYNNGNRFYINLNQTGKLSPKVQQKLSIIKSKDQIKLQSNIKIENKNLINLIEKDDKFSTKFKENQSIKCELANVNAEDYFVGMGIKKIIECYVNNLTSDEITYYTTGKIDYYFLLKLFENLEKLNNGEKITIFSSKQIATVYSKLIADISLKQMINQSMNEKEIYVRKSKILWEKTENDCIEFDKKNDIHINMLVRHTMELNNKIEYESRKILLYFFSKLESKNQKNYEIQKNMVEFGTKDERKIELFELGIEFPYIQNQIINLFGNAQFENKRNILNQIEKKLGKKDLLYLAVEEF